MNKDTISTFTIDFFELSFLAEACIPPVPIARNCFWKDLINKHYHNMTESERGEMYRWITREGRFNSANADCALFEARFNPDNQYLLTVCDSGQTEERRAFKMKGRYYISENTSIVEEYITNVTKIDAPDI